MAEWCTIAMETVIEEQPRVEVFPRTDSGCLRLSPHGLWDGIGVYTSPVVDLGEIFTLSGVFWESIEEYQTSIDSSPGLPKTLELRYHDYIGPTVNESGYPWTDGQLPGPDDPFWGDDGLGWEPWEMGYREGPGVRYVQWRAVLRTVPPPDETVILTETGDIIVIEGLEALITE